MPLQVRTRGDFLQNYDFPIRPLHDFVVDGVEAAYAPGHPKAWGDERDGFGYWRYLEQRLGEKATKDAAQKSKKRIDSAVSPDGKLLAISSAYPMDGILIFDIATKELRQMLEGCGTVTFRPFQTVHRQEAQGETLEDYVGGKPAYTLISNFATGEQRPQSHNGLIVWELNSNGQLFVEEEPINPSAIATKAIEAIIPELESEHEWSRAFVNASGLHADVTRALEKVSADHRRRNNTVFHHADIATFADSPFSHDGKLLAWVTNNRTTQHGMREAEDLPYVVVYDMDAGREVHRFGGHTDLVAWFGFSPDGRHIASVSWDGTLRMCSIGTGELEWATADSGGQSWSGAFSPDSKHIVWSSHGGKDIMVHSVADGKTLSSFPEELGRWCRHLSWDGTGEQIALCADRTVYVWRPFDGPEGDVTQRWALSSDDRFGRMEQVESVCWMGGGRLLALKTSDRTTLVYDTLTNAKEVFKRPSGVDAAYTRADFFELGDGEGAEKTYLSVDGDGRVRYWDRTVAPLPDAQADRKGNAESSRREHHAKTPKTEVETGSSEGITSETDEKIRDAKSGIGAEPAVEAEREAWAQKGSEIWTAE